MVTALDLTIHAATLVSGTIGGNVRWVPEKSPYVVSGDIMVPRGSTLTIVAGTEVRFRRSYSPKPYTNRGVLRVLGTLKVEGTREKSVYFGLFEEGAMGDWGGIWIDGYYGGKVSMEHAEVENAQRGIYVSGGSPIIKQSRFSANFAGIHLEETGDFTVEGNILSGNQYGFYLDSSRGKVEKNSIVSNSWGIYSFLSKGVAISHNAIKSNTFGIAIDGGLKDTIEYNDFSIRQPNDYGIYLLRGKPAGINHNNFFYDPAIVVDPQKVFWYVWNDDNAGEVDARHNWWDTTKPEIIEAYIMDRRDRSYLGLVNYLPMAQRPISGTADDISAPVVSLDTLRPFSPVLGEPLQVTYILSETAESLRIRIIDENGLMGPKSRVLLTEDIKGGDKNPLLRDGQHDWVWEASGRLPDGRLLVDGTYVLEMVAMDREVPGLSSEPTRTRLIIDTNPPDVLISFPAQGATIYDNTLTVRGTVQDDNLMGGFILVSTELGSGGRGNLEGNNWHIFLSRLREGPNHIFIRAYDGAGNMAQETVMVYYEPILDLQVTTPTNVDSQVIKGTVRNNFLGKISRVEVTANDRQYAAIFTEEGFQTPIAIPLILGNNEITATAYDTAGVRKGSVMAVIEHDPLYDITIENVFLPGLQMVSVPMMSFQSDANVVFGPPLARWHPGQKGGAVGYVYDGDIDPLTPYRGYWWKPDQSRSVRVRGKGYDPAGGFAFPLDVGWNQIGCPFLKPVQWEKVKFAADQGRALSWQEAVAEGWISRGLWTYREGGYVPAATLEPWSGYWILARRRLQVVIPPEAVVAKAAKTTGIIESSKLRALGTSLDLQPMTLRTSEISGWSMQLALIAGEYQDRYNYLGVIPGASPGFNPQYDLEKPPPAQGVTLWLQPGSDKGVQGSGKGVYITTEGVDVSATMPFGSLEANGGGHGDVPAFRERWGAPLAADYRGLNQLLVWDIYLYNNADTDSVTLQWSGNFDPKSWQVSLVDPATDSRSPMAAYGTRTFHLDSGKVKHLSVVASLDTADLTLTEVLPYPNPWDMRGPLRLGFTINQPASIEARIYDVAGNLVRILSPGRREAGRHYLEWDGRNGRGKIAANGLYFYQVTARPAFGRGKPVKAQGRLAILR